MLRLAEPEIRAILILKCKKLTLKYKLTELRSQHFRELQISQPEITLDLDQYENFSTTPGRVIYNSLKKLTVNYEMPSGYLIDELKFNNGTINIKTGNYLYTSLRTDLTSQNVQTANPFVIESNGIISRTEPSTADNQQIDGKFQAITEYNPEDNSITFSDDSGLTINDMGEFIVQGKIDSLSAGTGMLCYFKIDGLVYDHLPNLLTRCECIPDTVSNGECEISFKVNGQFTEVNKRASDVFKKFKNLNM